MRSGGFPAQEQLLRDLVSRRRAIGRRTFVLTCLAGMAGGLGAGWWAHDVLATAPAPAPGTAAPEDRRHRFAADLAAGDLDALLDNYAFFLNVVDKTGGDEQIWMGMRRLVKFTLSERTPRSTKIGRAVVRTLDYGHPPPDLARRTPQLRRMLAMPPPPSRDGK